MEVHARIVSRRRRAGKQGGKESAEAGARARFRRHVSLGLRGRFVEGDHTSMGRENDTSMGRVLPGVAIRGPAPAW